MPWHWIFQISSIPVSYPRLMFTGNHSSSISIPKAAVVDPTVDDACSCKGLFSVDLLINIFFIVFISYSYGCFKVYLILVMLSLTISAIWTIEGTWNFVLCLRQKVVLEINKFINQTWSISEQTQSYSVNLGFSLSCVGFKKKWQLNCKNFPN